MKTSWQMIVILIVGYFVFLFGQVSADPQSAVSTNAHCKVIVPSNWGEFIGASTYGLAFKDDQGIIRMMNQMPCGLEGRPNVSLEIARQ
jgi:hypothetical protein